jgi:hypothetical protein
MLPLQTTILVTSFPLASEQAKTQLSPGHLSNTPGAGRLARLRNKAYSMRKFLSKWGLFAYPGHPGLSPVQSRTRKAGSSYGRNY